MSEPSDVRPPGFWRTCYDIATKPRATFGQGIEHVSRFRPLPFLICASALGGFFDGLWLGVLSGHALLIPMVSTIWAVIYIVPIAYLSAAVAHFLLNVLGGKTAAFRETFGLIAYAGAARLLSVVPVVGAIASVPRTQTLPSGTT